MLGLLCIEYIAYTGTVVLIVKISFILFAHCVDSKDKLYTFCTLCLRVLFTFHIYPNTISYQVTAGQLTLARKGHNLFFNLCKFRKPLKKAKAERP